MSLYEIRIEDELIVLDVEGKQTVDSVKAIKKEIEEKIKQNPKVKDVLVLTKGSGAPDMKALKLSIQGMLALPIQRLAVAGSNPDRMSAAKFVVKAGGDSKRFKVFRLEKDARAWLES